MKKINKRRILQLGIGVALTTPLAFVVSCNEAKEKIDLKKDVTNMFKQLSLAKISKDLVPSINSFFKNGWTVATNEGANPNLDLKSDKIDAYVKGFFYKLIKNYIAPVMDNVIPNEFNQKINEEKDDKAKIDELVNAINIWKNDLSTPINKQKVMQKLEHENYSNTIRKYLDLASFNEIKDALKTSTLETKIKKEIDNAIKFLKNIDFKKLHNQVVKNWVKQTINSQSIPTSAGDLLKTMFHRIGDRIGDKESKPIEVGFANVQKLKLAKAFFYSLQVVIEKTQNKGLILKLS